MHSSSLIKETLIFPDYYKVEIKIEGSPSNEIKNSIDNSPKAEWRSIPLHASPIDETNNINPVIKRKLTDSSQLSELPFYDTEETLQHSSSIPKALVDAVHYGTKFLGIFAYVGNFSYGWFSRTYTAKGLTRCAKLFFHVPDLPKNYGVISLATSIATPLIELPTDILSGCEAFNGIAFFDLNKETDKVDKAFRHAFKEGPRAYFREKFQAICATPPKQLLFEFGSELTFKIAAIASAYGRAEQLEQSFEDWMGIYKIIPITLILAGSYAYYKLGYSSQYERGLKFLSGDEKGATFIERYKNHRSLAIEFQPAFEGGFSAAVRGMSLSFLLGRLAENREWSSPELYYAVGAIAGFINAIEIFYPSTYDKYHENSHITESERTQIYQEHYGQMTWHQRAIIELTRPFLIGLAQSGLSCYFTATKLSPFLFEQLNKTGCPSWLSALVSSIPALLATAASYYPYYKADLYRELNIKANHKLQKEAEDEYVDLEAQLNANKNIEEKDDQPKPSRCARVTGIFTSAGSQISRLLVLLSSVVGNPLWSNKMSANDLSAISIGGGTLVGDNRYHTMTEPTIKTLAKFKMCQATPSSQGFFSSQKNKSNDPNLINQEEGVEPKLK